MRYGQSVFTPGLARSSYTVSHTKTAGVPARGWQITSRELPSLDVWVRTVLSVAWPRLRRLFCKRSGSNGANLRQAVNIGSRNWRRLSWMTMAMCWMPIIAARVENSLCIGSRETACPTVVYWKQRMSMSR